MYPTKPSNATQKTVAGIIVVIAVVLLLVISNISKAQHRSQSTFATMSASDTSTPTTGTTTAGTPSAGTTTSSTPSASGYKDGTYSKRIQYYVPNGYESIQVNLTLKNGVITDSNLQNSENNGVSAQYQEGFASEYKSSVVGKNIGDVNLSYVAGASDTTQAFDNAISRIMNDAKS